MVILFIKLCCSNIKRYLIILIFCQVANDVFARIAKRVGENKNHLQTINDRVNLAAARVDKLKGSNKATKVFACAKYPSESELKSFQSIIRDTEALKSPKHGHFKVRKNIGENMIFKALLYFFNSMSFFYFFLCFCNFEYFWL